MKMRKLKHKRAAYYRSDSRLDKVPGAYPWAYPWLAVDYAYLEIRAIAECIGRSTGRSTGMIHMFEVPYGTTQR